MEGNFLSRYNNKINSWKESIEKDPGNKNEYESQMSEYIINCMHYMKQYTEESEKEVNTDNVFNCKETSGLQRKDIFID